MINTIIFDFDGVILDSNQTKTQSFLELYKNEKKKHKELILSFHKDNLGLSRFKKIDYFQKEILKKDYDEKNIKNKLDLFSKIVLKNILKCQFIEGVINFIKNLNIKSINLFISSGSPEKELKYICNKLKIENYFVNIFGSPDSKISHIERIIKKYKVKNEEILFIGDSLLDYRISLATNVKFMGVGSSISKNIKNNIFYIESFHQTNDIFSKFKFKRLQNIF